MPMGSSVTLSASSFSAACHAFAQPKTHLSYSSSWPSMASSLTPSIKSSLGSSKSAFLQRGFSVQSVTFPGFFTKARSFGVFARAATEKTLYDFTVKVICWKLINGITFLDSYLLIYEDFRTLYYIYICN